MRFSTKSRYGLRLMAELACSGSGRAMPLKEISERQQLSLKYLEQLVTPLVRAGLIMCERGSQGWNRFNENVGLPRNIPIFSNRKNRTAVNKARIAVNTGELERQSAAKTLLREVETAYLDAVSAQSQYLAAAEKLRYARTSYELTGEQFRLGMKNTVELITAQNEYTSARQELLQAKYMALLNIELLNIYQGREVGTIQP